MSTTDTTAQADGSPMPDVKSATHADPAAEVTQAMTDFVNDLKAFPAEIETKTQQKQDRPMTQTMTRPALAVSAELDAPHQKAFEDYVRSGDDDALRGLSLEGKGLSTAVNGDGGYLVDPQTSDTP